MSWATANEQMVAVFLQRFYLRRVLVPMPVLVRDTARWVVSVDPELAAGADGPVSRRIKPGHEAAYKAFLTGISGAATAFPGYPGVEVFRPAGGQGGPYRIVYRFDSPAHLQAWLNSAEHAAWFVDPDHNWIGLLGLLQLKAPAVRPGGAATGAAQADVPNIPGSKTKAN